MNAAVPDRLVRACCARTRATISTGWKTHTDLRRACFAALAVERHEARERAQDFSWKHAAALFAGYLVPARPASNAGGAPAAPTLLS